MRVPLLLLALGALAAALPQQLAFSAPSRPLYLSPDAAAGVYVEGAADAGSYADDDKLIRPSFDTTHCPGYRVAGPRTEAASGFTLPLTLAGPPCHAYGACSSLSASLCSS